MKIISKIGGGADSETLDTRGTKVTGTAKERHFIRTYVRHTRPISRVINQNRLVQGHNWGGASASR